MSFPPIPAPNQRVTTSLGTTYQYDAVRKAWLIVAGEQAGVTGLQGPTGLTYDSYMVRVDDEASSPDYLRAQFYTGEGIDISTVGTYNHLVGVAVAYDPTNLSIDSRNRLYVTGLTGLETYKVRVDDAGSADYLANQVMAGDGITADVVPLPHSDRHLLEIGVSIDPLTLGINGSGEIYVVAAGMTGVQGVTGNQGGTGIHGATGIKGATGIQGVTGSQGGTGIKGATGIKGGTGIQGVTGILGPAGETGIKGATGVMGVPGWTGIRGHTGSQGATGVLPPEIHQPYDEPGVLTTGLYFDNTSTGDTSSQFIRGEYFNDEGIDTNHGQVTIGYDSKFQVVRSSDGAVLMSGGDTLAIPTSQLSLGPAPSMNPNYRFVTIGSGDNGDIFHYDGTFQLQNYVMSDLHGSHYNNFMLSPDQSPVAPTYPFVDTYDWGVTLYFDGTNVRAVRKDGKRSLLSTSWS